MTEFKAPQEAQIGDIVGELSFGPVTRTMLGLYAGASLDHNPIHIDIDFARNAGQPDVFAHGMLGMAQFGRLVTNWVGIGAVESLTARFTAIVPVGAQMQFVAKVIDRQSGENDVTLTLELEAFMDEGARALTGQAVVSIPA